MTSTTSSKLKTAPKYADDIIEEMIVSRGCVEVRWTRPSGTGVPYDAYRVDQVYPLVIAFSIQEVLDGHRAEPNWFLYGGQGPWFDQRFGDNPDMPSNEAMDLARGICELVDFWGDRSNRRARNKALRLDSSAGSELVCSTSSPAR